MKSNDIFPVRWVYGSLIGTTLYFNSSLADPFNSPKMWIVLLLAAWISGYVISFRGLIFVNKPIKIYALLLLAFAFSTVAVTVFTDFKYVGIFGDTQRRNGALTYLALAVIGLAASMFIRIFNVKRVYFATFIIGSVFALYAFLQTTGRDFVSWNNPYNSIIGTVGNPNFAAAVMSVMGVIVFTLIFIKGINSFFRVGSAALSAVLMFLIIQSGSRQGILSFLIGAGIFVVILLFSKNRALGVISLSGGVIAGIFSILGMLQVGPLQELLYKGSVSVRGYYWRAGLEMLKDNPLFGVGMDRYGAYFKYYREVGYPLSYGFDLTSSNAHNTFIQFFATGGILLGTSYLLLNGYIFNRAIIGLKSLSGNNRLLLAGVFSAWIAFHAQSLISIDNIGISIWGWVLGGSVIGLSLSSNSSPTQDKRNFLTKSSQIDLARVLISSVFAIIPFILIVFLYRAEVNTYNAIGKFDLSNSATISIYKELQIKVVDSKLVDPSNSLYAGMQLIQAGFTDEGLVIVKKIHASDPRNLDAINALALTSEQLNQIPEAITYREKMAKLDPWNAVNYLALGINYKIQGDLSKSKQMLDKILSFAPNNAIAEQAKTELAS